MNKAQDVRMMTIKMPVDAYEKLAQWAAFHLTSLNAEIVRSIRGRADQEQQQEKTVR